MIPERLRCWCAAPATPWIVAALAFVGCLPGLFSGLAADDDLRAAVLADPAVPDAAMFDARQLQVTPPWWTDPRWRAEFLRPLTVLSHQIDAVLWPDAPWAMHLVSMGWYLALLGVTHMALRELGGPRWAIGLALWLFAMDDGHAPSVAWIAARGTLLAAVFATLALVLHLRSRRRGQTPFAAMLCFALALASSESAVAGLGPIVAATMVLEPRTRGRAWALAPYVGLSLAWFGLRAHLGFGVAGTGLYLDPWTEPLRFVANAGPRAGLLIASTLGVPLLLDPLAFVPGAQWVAGLVSLAALGLLALLLRPLLRDDALARFFALATVLSAIPLTATVPQDRHTLLLGLGVFGLVTRVFVALAEGWLRARPLRAIAWSWFAVHVVLAPLLLPLRAWTPAVMRQFTTSTEQALPEQPQPPVVLLAAPSDLHIVYTRVFRSTRGRGHPDRFHTLYTGALQGELRRAGPRALELRTPGWFAAPMSQLFRDAPLAPGDTIATADFAATVMATDERGHPTVVRFDFDCVLEHCAIHWLRWQGDHAVPATPPTASTPLSIDGAGQP